MERRAFLQTYLDHPPADLQEEFHGKSTVRSVGAGEIFASEGDVLEHFPLVLDGLVRVFKVGETGREITLYRILPGEGCILSASCLLANTPFPALAETEENTRIILVPKWTFQDWIERYPAWRKYIFGLFSRRLSAILATVEEVAFRRMDSRIGAFFLMQMETSGPELHLTHADIAHELGTAREVVSRILKDFERMELVSLSRATIRLKDPERLRRLIEDH